MKSKTKPKYYRNMTAVISDQGIEIDPGSLWEFKKDVNQMILVDEDEYHTAKPSAEIFEKEDSILE